MVRIVGGTVDRAPPASVQQRRRREWLVPAVAVSAAVAAVFTTPTESSLGEGWIWPFRPRVKWYVNLGVAAVAAVEEAGGSSLKVGCFGRWFTCTTRRWLAEFDDVGLLCGLCGCVFVLHVAASSSLKTSLLRRHFAVGAPKYHAYL